MPGLFKGNPDAFLGSYSNAQLANVPAGAGDVVFVTDARKVGEVGSASGTFSYYDGQNWCRVGDDAISASNSLSLLGLNDGLAVDFVDGSMLVNDSVTSGNRYSGRWQNKMAFSRASTAGFMDDNGVYQTVGANVPRISPTKGVLIEPTSTNLIRNNSFVGAVAGSPGTPPNLTTYTSSKDGLAVSIVGVGTVQGLPYLDFRIQGTATATNQIDYMLFDSVNPSGFVQNDNVAFSAYVALIAGSFTGINNANLAAAQFSATPSYLSEVTNPQDLKLQGLTSTLKRVTQVGVANQATVASVRPRTQIAYNSGAVIDITLRFAAPQLEKLPFTTSPIMTTSATVTRNTDVIAPLLVSATPFNQNTGTLYMAGTSGLASLGQAFHLLSINDGGTTFANAIELIRLSSAGGPLQGTIYQTSVQTGSPSTLALADNTNFKAALGWNTNDIGFTVGGVLSTKDTSFTPPTAVTQFQIGNGPSTAGYQANGFIRQLLYLTTRLTDTQLQALTV